MRGVSLLVSLLGCGDTIVVVVEPETPRAEPTGDTAVAEPVPVDCPIAGLDGWSFDVSCPWSHPLVTGLASTNSTACAASILLDGRDCPVRWLIEPVRTQRDTANRGDLTWINLHETGCGGAESTSGEHLVIQKDGDTRFQIALDAADLPQLLGGATCFQEDDRPGVLFTPPSEEEVTTP